MFTRRAAWLAAAAALWVRRGSAQVLRPPGASNQPGTGISLQGLVVNETPSGTPNGALAAFTLAHTPVSGSLAVYRNGIRQKPGEDYAAAGNTITFAALSTPQTGDLLLADYWR